MAQTFLNIVAEYWFWAMAGFLAGGALCIRNMMKNGCSFPLAVISVTTGLYGGFLGARSVYMLIFHPHLLLENPIAGIAFWQGTGTWLGGPLFGALGALIILKTAGKPILSNLGSMAPGLALGHAISRIGCLFAGCCYGSLTSAPWAIYSEKLSGMVHPTPIYSMVGELVSLAVLQALWRKPERRPYLPSVYGMLLAVHRFISESFRGEIAGPEIIPGLRVYQALCVFIFALSLLVFVILKWKKWGLIPGLCITALLTGALTIPFKPITPSVNADSDAKGLYLVVTRDLFSGMLDRWAAERRKNGFEVSIRPWRHPPSTSDIMSWIRRQVDESGGSCRYILIVGDCGVDEEKRNSWHVPSVELEIQIDRRTTVFVTDALFGDLDGDGSPDVPVGRLAVRSASQLEGQIRKILTHRDREPSRGPARAVIWAGAEGYHSSISRMIGSMAERLPEWITPFIIDGNPESANSGYPPDQPAIFLDQISRSPFLSLIVSHGSYRSVTPASYRGIDVFLSVEDVDRMPSQHPSGAMFLVGCDSGKFDMLQALGPSLSEAFSDHPGGPMGVVAATAETSPLTNYFFVKAMIDQLHGKNKTIGDFMLGVQRMLFQEGKRSLAEVAQGDELAKHLMLSVPHNERNMLYAPERLRHEALMYNLLGDPACRLTGYR